MLEKNISKMTNEFKGKKNERLKMSSSANKLLLLHLNLNYVVYIMSKNK